MKVRVNIEKITVTLTDKEALQVYNVLLKGLDGELIPDEAHTRGAHDLMTLFSGIFFSVKKGVHTI